MSKLLIGFVRFYQRFISHYFLLAVVIIRLAQDT